MTKLLLAAVLLVSCSAHIIDETNSWKCGTDSAKELPPKGWSFWVEGGSTHVQCKAFGGLITDSNGKQLQVEIDWTASLEQQVENVGDLLWRCKGSIDDSISNEFEVSYSGDTVKCTMITIQEQLEDGEAAGPDGKFEFLKKHPIEFAKEEAAKEPAPSDVNNLAVEDREALGAEIKAKLDGSITWEVKTQKHLKGTYSHPDSKTGANFNFEFIEHEGAKENPGSPGVTHSIFHNGNNVLKETYFPHFENGKLVGVASASQVEEHHVKQPDMSTSEINPKAQLVHHETEEITQSDLSFKDHKNQIYNKEKYEDLALLSFALVSHGVDGRNYPLSFWAHLESVEFSKGNGHIDTQTHADLSPVMFDLEEDIRSGEGQEPVLVRDEEDEEDQNELSGMVDIVLDEDEDVLDSSISDELTMDVETKQGGCWEFGRRRCRRRRRRRANHCGNLKTNWCDDGTCGCCPCCGRCGKECQKWPLCLDSGQWRKGCYYHDLQCGKMMWNSGANIDAHLTCYALIGGGIASGFWTGGVGTVATYLAFLLGAYGWTGCANSRTCTGGGHTGLGYCQGSDGSDCGSSCTTSYSG